MSIHISKLNNQTQYVYTSKYIYKETNSGRSIYLTLSQLKQLLIFVYSVLFLRITDWCILVWYLSTLFLSYCLSFQSLFKGWCSSALSTHRVHLSSVSISSWWNTRSSSNVFFSFYYSFIDIRWLFPHIFKHHWNLLFMKQIKMYFLICLFWWLEWLIWSSDPQNLFFYYYKG